MSGTLDVKSILDSISAAELKKHVVAAAAIRRDEGGEGEARMVRYILDALSEYGIPCVVSEFDAYLSYPRTAALSVAGRPEASFRCITHAFSASTTGSGLRSEAVLVSGDDFAPARGRIAIVDGIASPATVLRANRSGASAVIFVSPTEYLPNMIVSTVWGGAPTPDEVHRLPTIPVVTIAVDSGNEIKGLLRADSSTEFELKAQVDTGWFKAQLPEVRIVPAKPTGDFVLVGSHYCTWEYGATDNGTGVATLLELARTIWPLRDGLANEVRIAWWPGHSQGRYAGSTWYADTHFDDLSEHCIAYHNIDSPGMLGATVHAVRYTTADMESAGIAIVKEFSDQENPIVQRPTRAADQSFLAMGVPSCSITSQFPPDHPSRSVATGGYGPWWWHTEYDTLDKVGYDELFNDTRLSLAFLIRMGQTVTRPYRLGAAARELAEFLGDVRTSVEGRVELDDLLALADDIVRITEMLDAGAPVRSELDLNEVLTWTSRELNSLAYASRNRFSHDAAELMPARATKKGTLFPGMNVGLHLAGGALSRDDMGFAAIGVKRQANRYRTHLTALLRYLKETIDPNA